MKKIDEQAERERRAEADLKDNLLHHRSKPVLMNKNRLRFLNAIMTDVVEKDGKRYTIPKKWKLNSKLLSEENNHTTMGIDCMFVADK